MKFGIYLLFTILLCISCKTNQSKFLADSGNDTISKLIQIDKFKFKNKLSFDSLEYLTDTANYYRPKDLIELQDTLIKERWFGMHDYFNFYNIYYYSIQNKIGNIRPLTFMVDGADYLVLRLLLINDRTGNLIKSVDLYGGDSTGPLDNRYNESQFLNDSTIILKQIHHQCDTFYIGADLTVDTIKYRYIINNKVGFDIKKLDSLRIKTKYE
jgi:hypothetical protein